MATDTALSLRSSLPPSRERSTSLGLIPIELDNGCTEEGCSYESDNAHLTNVIRRHYLGHFGHRDIDGIVSDYADADTTVVIHVVNGERARFKGRNEIRKAFEDIFNLHPKTNSTFHLKHVVVDHNHGMAVWSATTPTAVFPQSSDTFVFNSDGKIIKQFFNCQMNAIEVPWHDRE
eukprot:14067812-Ditylum_brightwellii.AAC.1